MIEKLKDYFIANKNIFPLILLMLFVLILYRKWFFFNMLFYSDYLYFFKEALISKGFLWNYDSLGYVNYSFWRIFELIPIYMAHLNIPYEVSEKFTYFWPFILLAPILSYLLAYRLFKNWLAALTTSIVFSFNTYFLQINASGHIIISLSCTLTLLFFLSCLKIEKASNSSYFIIASLSLLLSLYDLRFTYIMFFISIFYFIFFIKFDKKLIKNIFFYSLLFLLLNLFWILPMIKTKQEFDSNVLKRPLFGNNYFSNIADPFTLHHPFWAGNKLIFFKVQEINPYFWFVPFFAFLGLILNRKNKYILFFGIVALLGIFLSKQIGMPFSNIYPWLRENFPGFNAFREATKFYFLILMGYSILIGAFIDYITTKIKKKRLISSLFRLTLIIFILLLFLMNTKSLLLNQLGDLSLARTIPKDYVLLNFFINNQSNYSRLLWVPAPSNFGTFNDNNPRISIHSLTDKEYAFLFNNLTSPLNTDGLINKLLSEKYSNNLADISSIKYFIVPIDNNKTDNDIFQIYTFKNRNFFINILDNLKYLKKIDIGTKDLIVYENKDYLDHIYASSINQTLNDLDKSKITNIKIIKINPIEYKLTLNETKNFYLYFSESYNQGWKLYQNFNWITAIYKKNLRFDNTHIKAYGFLNGWYIQPNELVKDPKGNYELTIYFQPQSYFSLGSIISGITLIGCIFYLIFIGKND